MACGGSTAAMQLQSRPGSVGLILWLPGQLDVSPAWFICCGVKQAGVLAEGTQLHVSHSITVLSCLLTDAIAWTRLGLCWQAVLLVTLTCADVCVVIAMCFVLIVSCLLQPLAVCLTAWHLTADKSMHKPSLFGCMVSAGSAA